MSPPNSLVTETGPREVRGLQVAFHPRFGLVLVDWFPEETGFTDKALRQYRRHAGAIQVTGAGGIGTRVTLTLANGEAVYEFTHRAKFSTGEEGYLATRRSAQVRMMGKSATVVTYDRGDFARFADAWPEYAGFTKEFLAHPHVQRAGPKGLLVTIAADGVRAEYELAMPHPLRRDAYLAERRLFQSAGSSVVTLPTAGMRSLASGH